MAALSLQVWAGCLALGASAFLAGCVEFDGEARSSGECWAEGGPSGGSAGCGDCHSEGGPRGGSARCGDCYAEGGPSGGRSGCRSATSGRARVDLG